MTPPDRVGGVGRPLRLRRACHVVPGSQQRMLAKACTLAADEVILDLEDAVAPSQKSTARAMVAAALAAGGFAAATVAVRINMVDGPHAHRDLIEVVGAAPAAVDVVVVPKVESPAHIAFVDHLLSGIEHDHGLPVGTIGIEAQIESAAGVVASHAVATACPRRMEALVLGPGDLAADLGMLTTTIGGDVEGYPGDGWHALRMGMRVAATAAGIQAVDGPYAQLDDPDGLQRHARQARSLGYDGKWSIHPAQIAVITEVFSVSPDDFARACELVAAYEAAQRDGHGAVRRDEAMVDEATLRMAQAIVARGRLAGMGAAPPRG